MLPKKVKKKEELLARRVSEQQMIAQTAEQFRTWRKRACLLAIVLFGSILSLMPFLSGHSLDQYWESGAKYGVYFVLLLFTGFIYAAVTTYNFWSLLKTMQGIYHTK